MDLHRLIYMRDGKTTNGVFDKQVGVERIKKIRPPKLQKFPSSKERMDQNGFFDKSVLVSQTNLKNLQLNGLTVKEEENGGVSVEKINAYFRGLKINDGLDINGDCGQLWSNWDVGNEKLGPFERKEDFCGHDRTNYSQRPMNDHRTLLDRNNNNVQHGGQPGPNVAPVKNGYHNPKKVLVPVLQKRFPTQPSSLLGLDSNYHFKVKRITEDGFVILAPLICSNPNEELPGIFELEDLQIYSGQDILKSVLETWQWQRTSFTVTFGSKVSENFKEELTHPNAIRLYQKLPQGLVYLNRQIQLAVHSELKSRANRYFNTLQPADILFADPDGSITLRIFPTFQNTILNYMKNFSALLPQPETFNDLIQKSPYELSKELYVVLVEGSFRRIRIEKLFYTRKAILVNFIDFGTVQEIRGHFVLYSCLKINENFAHFPPLAMKCKLRGIASLDVERFMDEVKNNYEDDLYVQFVRPVAEDCDDDFEVIPEIVLWSDEGEPLVNDSAVKNGLAVPEVPQELLKYFSCANFLVKGVDISALYRT